MYSRTSARGASSSGSGGGGSATTTMKSGLDMFLQSQPQARALSGATRSRPTPAAHRGKVKATYTRRQGPRAGPSRNPPAQRNPPAPRPAPTSTQQTARTAVPAGVFTPTPGMPFIPLSAGMNPAMFAATFTPSSSAPAPQDFPRQSAGYRNKGSYSAPAPPAPAGGGGSGGQKKGRRRRAK
eukprot:RCo029091